ncbi:APC family permease [Sphingomonas radiodurans]|uniref:APC family permease n=1 Tax=Sphingomonas radiodurans TaxID=2890321 RepID=UPI001E446BBF|nr:amino acid permease [Sphingomonas radiodurans]WBH15740.1 amino acid permease [Sphingomonas radiodurans]
MTTTRPFGFWTATALVVGGMIGSGIFMMPAALAPFGWTGTLAWVVSIAGALSIAYTIGRLAQELPQANGAVAIAGAELGELAGVLIGWSYWVSIWCANAAIAIAAASYLAAVIPVLGATPARGALTAVALLWLLTLLNLAGARRAGQFQVLTTILKLVPLIAVVVIAAWLGTRGEAQLPPLPAAGTLLGGFATAVTLTLFPLVGFEAAGVAAERVRDPARNVMRASMAGTLVTGLLYILVCSAIVLLLPVATVTQSSAPFALFVGQFWGTGASNVIALFAAIAAIGALNGWVLLQGEVPLGMARAGLLPAWFGRVSRADVPVRVLLLSSGLASALILTTSSPTLGGVFQFLALLTTCACLWFYLAMCVAALRRRVAIPAALVGIGFALFAVWGAGWEASGLSLLLVASAVPLYLLRPRAVVKPQLA